MKDPKSEKDSRRRHSPHATVITHLIAAFSAFNLGVDWATSGGGIGRDCPPPPSELEKSPKSTKLQRMIRPGMPLCPPCLPRDQNRSYSPTNASTRVTDEGDTRESSQSKQLWQLPPSIEKLFVGMSRVSRDDFIRKFDVGVPFLLSETGNEEVVILHSPLSLPPDYNSAWNSTTSLVDRIPFISSPEEATKNCLSMKIILESPQENHCLAIVGQHESHIIHKWMRVSEGMPAASLETPLQKVRRSHQRDNSFLEFPTIAGIKESLAFISNYAAEVEASLERLRPIAARVGQNNSTIIVMICNYGQVDLLMNFVCSARARGLDTSQVLLFATDSETQILAQKMGITAFYDGKIFGQLPTEAAVDFGDWTFMSLIMAKVHCIHMISQLEYNILYQDVDVIWYRHPLEYFTSSQIGDFDIYFQDNGSRHSPGEPYHANLGFFYARYNKRTQFFFSSLVRRGDLVLALDEQVTVNTMLGEHASFTGLKTKVLNGNDFPGGWHFHHADEYMKDLMQERISPYIFHMSWTAHKREKFQYLEQLGYVFISRSCESKIASKTLHSSPNPFVTAACCVAKPTATCNFRDKPSKIPCNHTNPKDEDMPSFW